MHKRNTILALFFLLLLGAEIPSARAQGTVPPMFNTILEQISAKTIFPLDEKTWLQHSLDALFPGKKFAPVSRDQYLLILQQRLAALAPSEANLFLTSAIRSLLAALPDPYAAFLSPREVEEEKEEHKGNAFKGFGLELAQRQVAGRTVVIGAGVLSKSPAAGAGILPGDRILDINGKPVKNLQQAFQWLNPEPLQLTLLREGSILHIHLAPGWIHLHPFDGRTIGKTGYIRMEAILPDSGKHFAEVVQEMQKDGITLLILDLRDCVGGDVKAAAQIAGYFLKPGALVFSEETRQGESRSLNQDTLHFSVPLVVLVDGATASAAELLSGALKDNRAASFYGTTTLGKGYIETTWWLQGGWGLRFTTARYLRPSGKEVQGTGVSPDVRCTMLPTLVCEKGKYSRQLETLLHQL